MIVLHAVLPDCCRSCLVPSCSFSRPLLIVRYRVGCVTAAHSNNRIGDAGAASLADGVRGSRTLQSLHLE